MRLLRLDLIAFGPFSGSALNFSVSAARPGLHLVYGPNEAGKSSTLRAVRAALFGFPHQTTDDFVHAYGKLRVGATLEATDGRTLSFVRRKGTRNTLLDPSSDAGLPDDALRPFLGHVKEDEFFSMFAIGHAELRSGGQEILKGQGRLSELLFMTGAGLPRLRRIERLITDEADALFKPRGEKPPINEALLRIKELRALQKEKTLPAAEYLRRTDALQHARARRTAVEEALATARKEESRLTRLSAALPAAARFKQLRSQIASLGNTPRLRDGFSSRRIELEREARSLAGRLEQLRTDLEKTQQSGTTIVIPKALLESGVEIERLFKRLGGHEKAAVDTQHRLAEIGQLEADARTMLRSVRPDLDLDLDSVEPLRLTRQEQATVRQLAATQRELTAMIRNHEAEIRRLNDRIESAQAELSAIDPPKAIESLRTAFKRASCEGNLDAELAEAAAEAAGLRRRMDQGLAALGRWQGSPDELARLPIPSTATVDRFETSFEEIEREFVRLKERRAEIERRIGETEQAEEQARRGGSVPTLEALHEARQHRDIGWREVRRELEGVEPGPDREAFLAESGGHPLADAVEASIRQSDDIADRLRVEAERVERLTALCSEREKLRVELQRLCDAEAELLDRRARWEAEWKQQWPFLSDSPATPREMRDWLARHRDLVRLVGEFERINLKANDLKQRVEAHVEVLSGALQDAALPASPSLSSLLEIAERSLVEQDAIAERRRALLAECQRSEDDRRNHEYELSDNRSRLAAVASEWSSWMKRIGLPETAPGEATLVVLDTLSDVFGKLDAIELLRQRVAGMKADADQFAAEARRLAERLAPDLATRPAPEIASQLHARLVEGRSARDRRDELTKRHETLRRDLKIVEQRIAEVDAELAALCREGGCDDPSQLPAVEERSAELRRLERQRAEAEQELQQRSGGRTVDEFLAEIDAADPDQVDVDRERISEQLQRLQDQRVELEGEVTRHEQELSRMTGGAEAVTAAEDLQAVIARLAADVERYAKLRFAARLLRDGRERYRQRTGSAVLERAGELFRVLTGGSFRGLAVDCGENDEPLLVGERSDGRKVQVEGMSDGTADQLYLALRLAGLSAWLADHEPMPFLVDDILVHFDDDRSAAALKVLATLAERTQVMLFTHHAHLRELAIQTLPSDLIRVHELTQMAHVPSFDPDSSIEPAEPVPANNRSNRSLF